MRSMTDEGSLRPKKFKFGATREAGSISNSVISAKAGISV